MIRIVAPSRLHFGLFEVTLDPAPASTHCRRRFGGVGLMIDRPGVWVAWRSELQGRRVEGIHAARALEFALRFEQALPPPRCQPYAILVERCPPQHVGLGVGTQLGLAIAKALAMAAGYKDWSAVRLAQQIGRGERSAIGIHGFDHGGLIVEAGKVPTEAVAPLWFHVRPPDHWRVLLVLLTGSRHWYGQQEQLAFTRIRSSSAERLRQLAIHGIVPAAQQGDLQAFGQAVHEFNRLAGEPFIPLQGGLYASPLVECWIQRLRQAGIHGVGQSSWGPTVFAIVDEDMARYCLHRWRDEANLQIVRIATGHQVYRANTSTDHTNTSTDHTNTPNHERLK
jgi:beta-RFAP synthase